MYKYVSNFYKIQTNILNSIMMCPFWNELEIFTCIQNVKNSSLRKEDLPMHHAMSKLVSTTYNVENSIHYWKGNITPL